MSALASSLANQLHFSIGIPLGKGEVESSILSCSTIISQVFSMVSGLGACWFALEPVMNMRRTTHDLSPSSSDKTSDADAAMDRLIMRYQSRMESKKIGSVRLCACKTTAWAPCRGPWVAIADAGDGHLMDDGWSVSLRGNDPACMTKRVGRQTERLHRRILGVPPGYVVDHVNGNPLDNRRVNLRVATPSQNAKNRRAQRGTHSGYRGVHLHRDGRWRADIWADGVKHFLGIHDTAEDAAAAYDKAAIELHGEFARPNKPKRPSV